MTDTPAEYPAHPQLVVDAAELSPTFRPADMKVIKAITGRSPSELLQNDDVDEGEKMQALAFIMLRAQYPDEYAKTLWDLAEQADITMAAAPVDPTSGGTSTISPPSADSGG